VVAQEELEQKVAGLLMEKEHKTAEALKLKTELEGRISQLQLMMAQLDDKVRAPRFPNPLPPAPPQPTLPTCAYKLPPAPENNDSTIE
jgi:hypothetical protein